MRGSQCGASRHCPSTINSTAVNLPPSACLSISPYTLIAHLSGNDIALLPMPTIYPGLQQRARGLVTVSVCLAATPQTSCMCVCSPSAQHHLLHPAAGFDTLAQHLHIDPNGRRCIPACGLLDSANVSSDFSFMCLTLRWCCHSFIIHSGKRLTASSAPAAAAASGSNGAPATALAAPCACGAAHTLPYGAGLYPASVALAVLPLPAVLLLPLLLPPLLPLLLVPLPPSPPDMPVPACAAKPTADARPVVVLACACACKYAHDLSRKTVAIRYHSPERALWHEQ